MDWIEALILGLIQGLTEYLPVSSSGHLAIGSYLFGVEGEENSGLCTGSENYWVINSKSSEKDIKATEDFLAWVVTSEAGTKMMAEQFGVCPFNKAVPSENVFCKQADAYVAEGKYPVTWAFTETPNVDNWRAGIVAALTQYTVGGGSWDDVVNAYVNGWATEYKNQ